MTQPQQSRSSTDPAMDRPRADGREVKEHIGGSTRDGQTEGRMEQAKDQAREGLQRANEQIDQRREMAADRVDSVADKLHDRADEQGGMQGKVGAKAADSMEQAAGYLREHQTQEIWSDLERYAKDHPMQALGGAIVGGFLLGRILR